jgi:pSer/pThr/pTyr-binding forkhead associated (FHA) protein
MLKFNEKVLREFALERAQVWIGRKPGNQIVIENAAVSAEHARIIQEDGAYYIEDLASTNGTYLNDQRVEKAPLYDQDQVRIGKHLLVYLDETRPRPAESEGPPPNGQARERQRAAKGSPRAGAGTLGAVRVVEGKTDRSGYELTGRLTIIGSDEKATIRLTGWFAPKLAAVISRRPDGYSVSRSDAGTAVLVNGDPIEGRSELHDGDLLEVAGVKLQFSFKDRVR